MRKLSTLLILICFGWGSALAQITLPYSEDLEGEGIGSTSCGATQTFSVIQWTNESGDDIDWVIDVNGTGSTSTGPTANGGADHNPGISGGKYLYIEASGCATDTANLVSDVIYSTGTEPNIFFEFWYHQYGANINVLYVQSRQVVGGNPGPWVHLDTLYTPPPGLDMWQQGFYDISGYIGDTFQLRLRGVTGTSFGSDLSLDDFNVYSIAANDAGVISIDAPVSPAPVGPNNVDVSIMNFGADTLQSASIGWEFNGVPQTPFAWTGSLINGQSQSGVNIGSANVAPGIFTIKAWSSMPNNSIDSIPGNDTTFITGCSGALRGSYTAGGPTDDFATLEDLSFVLSTCGIDSHTVINISPGFYTGRIILDHVPGTGTNATLTIDGGDTSLVTISNSSGATIYLDGTDYTTIRRMTIEAMGNLDNFGVQLRDTASWNTIDSCRIRMDDVGTGLSDVIGVSASDNETSSTAEGQNAIWTMVSNCHIIGGEKSIHFEGQQALRTIGNRFMNNLLENAEDYGFYMDDQDSIAIIGNTIRGLRQATAADGIYTFDMQEFDISENLLVDVPDYGIYLSDANRLSDGGVTSRARVVNNMVSSLSDFGIYIPGGDDIDIYHNTIANASTSTSVGALRIGTVTGLDIRNNVLSSDGTYALYSDQDITLGGHTVNYNNYFTTGPNLVDAGPNIYADLASWQGAWAGGNANSVSGDPVFLGGLSDLHVLSPVINDAGDNSVGISVDIDGDARPIGPNVDIGADEFTPVSNDALAITFLDPSPGCGDSNTVVSVVIRSLGQNVVTSLPITVNYSGTGSGTMNFTYTDSLSFNEYDTVNIGILNTYLGGTYTFTGFVALSGDQNTANDSFPSYTVTFTPVVPQGIDGVGCGVDSAYIYGAPGFAAGYNWYQNMTDTVPIATGDSFLIPSITAQNTYYMQYADNEDSLSTGFPGGNGQSGNMFDVSAVSTTTITGLSGNFNPGTNIVDVWYRTDSYTNSPNSSAGWIQVVTGASVVSAGNGQGTLIPVPLSITIPGGQQYGFYVLCTTGGVDYTNGVTVGGVWATNGNLTIYEGVGRGTPAFTGSTFSPRNWNGTVFYGSSACSDVRVPVSAVTSPGVSVNLGNDTTLCVGSYTLDAGTNATFYDWTTTDTTQTITVNSSGTYGVVVSDTFGCEAADDINLILSIPPSVNLGSDVLLCDGASVTLDAGNPGSTFNWSSGGTSQTETFSSAGTVTVAVTDSVGCMGMDTVVITTGATPAANFSFTVGGQGLTYSFSDISTGVPTSWSWNFGDGNTDNTQNPSHTYAANGSYTVTLTVTNDCGSNVFTELITVVGIEQALAGGMVSLYPNPNHGQFKLEFRGLLAEGVEMRIMDVKGQVVMESSIEEQGTFVKEVDMSRFAKGMYLMQITANGEQILQRFVVE